MIRRHRTRGGPLSFSLTPSQVRRVEMIAAGLPSEYLRHSLRARVSAKLRLAAPIGLVPDELVDNCITSALKDIGGDEVAA